MRYESSVCDVNCGFSFDVTFDAFRDSTHCIYLGFGLAHQSIGLCPLVVALGEPLKRHILNTE